MVSVTLDFRRKSKKCVVQKKKQLSADVGRCPKWFKDVEEEGLRSENPQQPNEVLFPALKSRIASFFG